MDFGSFDQCLQVSTEDFHGQYCMIEYRTPLVSSMKYPTQSLTYKQTFGDPPEWILPTLVEKANCLKSAGLWLGTCMPSTCTVQDVHNIYSTISKEWASQVEVLDCQSKSVSTSWPPFSFVARYILISLIGICVVGSILEWRDKSFSTKGNIDDSWLRKLLKCFSMITSTRNLVTVREVDRNELSFLSGVRVILAYWVMVGHCAMYPEKWKEMKHHAFYSYATLMNWFSIYVENGYPLIEIFFMMSGFLTYLSVRVTLKKTNGKIDIIEFIIQKYFRIIPPFVFVLLLYYVAPTLGIGPLWNSVWLHELDKCGRTGWMNFLFINNFASVKDICMAHSWFLGSMLQTQIAALLLIMIVYRWPKAGVTVGAALIFICSWIDYKVALYRKYPMLAYAEIENFDILKDFSTYIYYKPFNHFASTVIGMALSWYILNYRQRHFSKTFHIVAWILAVGAIYAVTFAIYVPVADLRISSAYYAVRNIFWTLGTSWIVYACVTGNAWLVSKVLSFDLFIIISRISYNMFLIHPLVIMYGTATMRERIVTGKFGTLDESYGIFVMTGFLSIIAYFVVESPFDRIYNSFIKRKKTPVVNGAKK